MDSDVISHGKDCIGSKLRYTESADIAKTAIKTGKSVRTVLKSKDFLSDNEIERLLDPATMV